MEVTRVSIDTATRAPTGQTNTYLFGTDDALLVDPAGNSTALDDELDERSLAHVAVTHHHRDHVGAVADYARRHDATVWTRTGRERAFESATGIEPDRTFAEGTDLPVDGGHVRVLDTPGHAPEHVAFACPDGVAVGDLAVAEGSVVVGAPEGDMRAYLASLRRLHARNPSRLYPAHGPVVEGADVRATLSRLIAHRLDRERRVATAVEAGARTVSEVTDRAYEKDVSAVRDLAEATVDAHLEKLAVEGRLQWDGDRVQSV